METTLHRQLKELYAGDPQAREVRIDGFRIDAVVDGVLVEIQQASLSALRQKTRRLLERRSVLVVKPLAAHKTIFRLARACGPLKSTRTSPRHETLFDVFAELVHFVDVFPHPRLTIEVLLTRQEELRVPKRRSNRWRKDYRVQDRRLIGVEKRFTLRTADDLASLLPDGLQPTFTTAELAQRAGIPRWLAQKMAYCLRRTGAVGIAGKRRNAIVYRRRRQRAAA